MLFPIFYLLFFVTVTCGVIALWYAVHRTQAPNGPPDPFRDAPALSQQDASSRRAPSDFFVGYSPQDKQCREYLVERCVQRRREAAALQRRRRLSKYHHQQDSNHEDDGDDGALLLTVFKHFRDRSNEAIDQLITSGSVVKPTATRRTEISTKRKLTNEVMSHSQPDDALGHRDTDVLGYGDEDESSPGDDDVFGPNSGVERLDIEEDFETLVINASTKAARDVVLPLLLDKMVSQLWNKTVTPSCLETIAPQQQQPVPSISSIRQQYPLFDLDIGYLYENKHSNPSSAPEEDDVSVIGPTNFKVVASSHGEEDETEIYRTRWLRFVQMDRITVRIPLAAEDEFEKWSQTVMPCVAFVGQPDEHAIDNVQVDVVPMKDSGGTAEESSTLDTGGLRRESDGTAEESSTLDTGGLRGESDGTAEESSTLDTGGAKEKSNHSAEDEPLNPSCIDETVLPLNRPDVSFRQLRYPGTPVHLVTPNDPEFQRQWSLKTIKALEGWEHGMRQPETEHEVVVAVIDTGCDLGHYDLHDKYWKNEGEICDNGIDDDHNGYVDDCYGYNFYGQNSDLVEKKIHGTPVSGAIAAHTNNYYGIAGVCWRCRIMCARIGVEGFNTGDFAEALNYAVGFGVRVINYSGNGAFSRIQEEAIRAAQLNDTVVVTCAGNSACNEDSTKGCADLGYPGKLSLANIINVGATDRYDRIAKYSNYGQHSVHLFAPSGDLLPQPGTEKFKVVYGTSFSAPIVSGAVALILSIYPTLSSAHVKHAIVSTCRQHDLEKFTGKAQCSGILNLSHALREAAFLWGGVPTLA